jgi:hypothetical protein
MPAPKVKEDVMTNEDKIAALEREVAELKAAQPKPQPSREDQERATAKWIDEMHQMREGRMAFATPPSVVRDFAVLDDRMVKEIALRDARAPTGPSSQGVIRSSQTVSGVHTGGKSSGWVDPRPLSNPPGTFWVDAQCIADEVRQRKERERGG